MKLNYKKYLPHFIAALLLLTPIFLFAQIPGPSGATIQNPLGKGNDDVHALLLKIMNLVATVGAVIVVFFIIYSGYKFVTARGNEAKVTEARETFFATIIGGAILLGADVIANVVIGTVNTIKK